MGNYTGLRVNAVLKPEFIPVIESLYAEMKKAHQGRGWTAVAEQFPQYSFLLEWSKVDRCMFIPFGHDSIFGRRSPEDAKEWDLRFFTPPRWKFSCALKNYEGEIQVFLAAVLFPIAERVDEIQYWSEGIREPIIGRAVASLQEAPLFLT